MKRNVVSVIIFFFLIYLGFEAYRSQYYPCNTPLTYKLGEIDTKFNLKQQEALADMSQAAKIINDSYGQKIFTYDTDGDITVNFVYDQRTAMEESIFREQGKLDAQNSSLQLSLKKFRDDVNNFEAKLDKLNATIQKYNTQGGAPPDVYQDLVKQQKELIAEGEELNSRAKQLNLDTTYYNSQVDTLNENVDQFNDAITQKPEEGQYSSSDNTISIYFVDNQPELIHTLAHEFGHARGMDHILNPYAIMFPYTSKYIEFTDDDKKELENVCEPYPISVYWSNQLLIKIAELKMRIFKN